MNKVTPEQNKMLLDLLAKVRVKLSTTPWESSVGFCIGDPANNQVILDKISRFQVEEFQGFYVSRCSICWEQSGDEYTKGTISHKKDSYGQTLYACLIDFAFSRIFEGEETELNWRKEFIALNDNNLHIGTLNNLMSGNARENILKHRVKQGFNQPIIIKLEYRSYTKEEVEKLIIYHMDRVRTAMIGR